MRCWRGPGVVRNPIGRGGRSVSAGEDWQHVVSERRVGPDAGADQSAGSLTELLCALGLTDERPTAYGAEVSVLPSRLTQPPAWRELSHPFALKTSRTLGGRPPKS